MNKPIFSSYSFNQSFFDEVFDENQNVKNVYKKLFDIYSSHSINYLSGIW